MSTEVVLFDFFGTLVHYEPDVTRLAYPATHGHLVEWGSTLTHDAFVTTWGAASAALEARANVTLEEHSMLDTGLEFGARLVPELSAERSALLAASLLDEWRHGVRHIDGVVDLVRRLATRYRLGIVSNTHDSAMVPEILAAMGVADAFELVVLSVDHGYRKPHPSIYEAAIDRMGCAPAAAAFVGDSFDTDYAGPTAVGLDAYLIDPMGRHPVPDAHRLAHILDLERALLSQRPS